MTKTHIMTAAQLRSYLLDLSEIKPRTRTNYQTKRNRFLRRAAKLNDTKLSMFQSLIRDIDLATFNVYAIRSLIRVAEGNTSSTDVIVLHYLAHTHPSANATEVKSALEGMVNAWETGIALKAYAALHPFAQARLCTLLPHDMLEAEKARREKALQDWLASDTYKSIKASDDAFFNTGAAA